MGKKVSQVHLRNLCPFPNDLADIMKRFKYVIIPELNLGQLSKILRGETLIDIKSICKVQGKPFKESELVKRVLEIMAGKDVTPFLVDTLETVELGYKNEAPAAIH
jgi:2-oxoglutarate ferredoxin oxidoreductase subunit alpha